MLLHSHWIIQYEWPNIVEGPLMLTMMIGQWACGLHFCIERWTILLLWIMWLCSPLTADRERLKFVDPLLTLTLNTSQQPLYSLYLNPKFIKSLLTTNILFLCIIICIRMVGSLQSPIPHNTCYLRYRWRALSHSSYLGQQFTGRKSIHQFVINIAQLPHLS